MRHSISILALCAGLAPLAATGQEAEVIHWWTSAGELQAVRAFADACTAAGGTWVDSAVAGASAARQAATTRIIAGDPPAGAQFNTGKEFEDLAAQGLLVDLSAVAEQGNWAATTPEALLTSVKSDGKVFAMPVSIHGRNWIWYNKAALDAAGVAVPPTGWGEEASHTRWSCQRYRSVDIGPGGERDASVITKFPDVWLFQGKKNWPQASCGILRWLNCQAGAAFRGQKGYHAPHGRVIDPVEHLAPRLVLQHESRLDQRGQVMRERRGCQSEMRADLADPETLVPRLDQKAEDRQTGIVAKGSKGAGVWADHGHLMIITTILVL